MRFDHKPFDYFVPTFFEPEEFRDWADRMSVILLAKLDVFRAHWGAPVNISKHPLAIGREDNSKSQHNVRLWGEVRGIDLQPRGMIYREDMERAIECARLAGFTGIGIYPHWQPTPGIHVDVRLGRKPLQPAMWGALRPDPAKGQEFTTLEHALSEAPPKDA